ncbi:hypothetical protein CHS0354_023696 [Potamilus streckersoni]|uniref:DUF4549 domain-containing protein n=1 Tax=Potamilus streckersoni TaxID=2493646 RepID=A0AAE0SBP2_9BIVA|nr:hypothetical protein CHS0354_023696 [Potamilus streckersoni]
MSLDLADLYRVSGTDKVLDLDTDLRKDLDELKSEIEENEMVHQIPHKPISSVPLPKDAEYFMKERKLVIDRVLQVSEAHPLNMHAEILREEMLIAEEFEYTANSLPLLLHQYFIDRIHQLVQIKFLHMLRWKRFCEHTSTIEVLYTHYQKRLSHILAEYNDCIQRAQRLAVAREGSLDNNDVGMQAIKLDDMLIYLRSLVCHFHSMKRFNQFAKVLQWIPVIHKTVIAPDKETQDKEELTPGSRMSSRYQDDIGGFQRPKSGISRPSSGISPTTQSSIPQPPPINPTLLSTTPLPSSALSYAAAACGGGLATDEENKDIPFHVCDFQKLKPQLAFLLNVYGIKCNLDVIHNTGDEMEMFAEVNRKFKQIFLRQEHYNTFKTYDRIETGQESWGSESPQHTLRQESNWLPYILLKPERDPHQEKQWTQLRQLNNLDPLIKMQAHFLHITDPEKVQDILKDHAAIVRNPPKVNMVQVSGSHARNTTNLWKNIYSYENLHSESGNADSVTMQDLDDKDLDNSSHSRSAKKRKDSYDYLNTVQMLGLDDGDEAENNVVTLQGAYLSFLQLRHLRLRDMRRTCLSILNYFRSIERTLTINDRGLTEDSSSYRSVSPQNHRTMTETDGTVGGGGGLGSHSYVHNTPLDYKLNETEFMEFADVDNHDDFYMKDEGRIHVQDQRGYFIMYDAAIKDLENLERDLQLVATHYIEKDKEHQVGKTTESARSRQQVVAGDFDIPSYAHQEVDRFGILCDLWTNEASFLECKSELLDCYMEAYHHVFDRDEKRKLAQVITNIIYKRPQFDLRSNYFIKMYRTECVVLHLHTNLIKSILDKQIEEEREYNQRVCREGDKEFGLPHRVIPKQPISINQSKSAIKNIFMLEFHPSLAIAGKIPEALSYALRELIHIHKPATVLDSLIIEKKLYEFALEEWNKMEHLGASYSTQIQKDLFSGVYVEDPLFMCEVAQTLVTQNEQEKSRKSAKEKQLAMVNSVARLLEALTLRHRLIDAAWECEIVAKIYKKQANEMGFGDFHLNLRSVQFEIAGYKENAGKPPPIFITAVQQDDSSVDKIPANYLYLSIQELDEAQVGRFSFRSRDGIFNLLRPGGLESFQVVLKAQIVHKNALTCAVLQATNCQPVKEQEWRSGRASPTETKSEKSSMTQLTGMSSGTGATVLGTKLAHESSSSKKKTPEAFISIQLEKTPIRDLMLNEYIDKKNMMGSVLRNPEEAEKLKRSLISQFCYQFNLRMAQYSLRAQLLAYYNSILNIMEDFPNVRDTYFMMGESNEKKGDMDSTKGIEPDPRIMRKRPRRLLSEDGKHVLNIWFIPHHTEILVMFKKCENDMCVKALSYCLMIISALHDMLHYLCAHSRLGSAHARLGSRRMEFVSADWGGTEGIGAELREIQKQIDNLPNPTDPAAVSEFMALRRDIMFLEFDTAVRHCMADTFLSTGNVQSYKSIVDNIHHALPALSNVQRPTLMATYLPVPEPLEPRDLKARELFPWRSFIGRNGPFPTIYWQWHMIEYYIQLCLAGLKEVDRHVANGEILGVTLLMEDVLQTGFQDVSYLKENQNGEPDKKTSASRVGSAKDIKRDSVMSLAKLEIQQSSLSRTQEPIESYKLLKFFLLLWKCVEFLKADWGRRRLGVEAINTTALYRDFCKVYKTEILLPVLQSIARRLGQGEMYEGIALETDPLVMPKGASEIEVRFKQLTKLMENLECYMIIEVKKRLARELTLVLAERGRGEETALATDLWKKPVMKESFTIAKPHIAEQFVDLLMTDCNKTEDDVTFSMKHLNKCVTDLAQKIMAREKQNYESYTMFYENLLKSQHQLLYQREQEVKQLRDQMKVMQHNIQVEVQWEMANQTHDILMEITALRAKIAEMREMSVTMQHDIRDRVREDYNDLIQNLFNSSFQLKGKLEEFRNDLHDDVHEKISDVRREAFEAVSKIKQKYGATTEESEVDTKLTKSEQLRRLQQENHELNILVLRMKSMNSWKRNHDHVNFSKTIDKLKKSAEKNRKEGIENKMLSSTNALLLKQHLSVMKKKMASAEKELNDLKKKLDKEMKDKQEKDHEEQQRLRGLRQLEQAKQANIEKLLEELQDREKRLTDLSEEKMKNEIHQKRLNEKVKKESGTVKKLLNHERNLKLDAFQRVDELQAQVYDYETVVSRSQSAMTLSPAPTSKSRSRAQSATQKRSQAPSRGTPSSIGGLWPPPVMWPANRVLTPEIGRINYEDSKLIQRPKTVGSRLRSRIADQLLNELDLDQHRTIVQLEELQLDSSRARQDVNY